MAAETNKFLAWNKKYKAFIQKHPKPVVSFAAEYDAFMKKHPKPGVSKALVAWHEQNNAFYIRHPFPTRHSLPKNDLDIKSSQMLPQTKTKTLSLLDSSNQSLVSHMPKPEPIVVFDLHSQSLIPLSHSEGLVLQEQWDTIRDLSILDSDNQSLVPYMPQPEPLSIFNLDSQSLIPRSNCKAAVLQTQGDALNQESEDVKSKDLDLIGFYGKKSPGKAPEALTSDNMEKMDDWNAKYNAWNEKYNAFKKSHPKPPRSKEEVSWERAYRAFVKKRSLKPGISNNLVSWNRKLSAFYKKNPIPVLSTQPHKRRSNALKRKSEALNPHISQPKTKILSIPDSCNQSLVRHIPKPKSLAVVGLDHQSPIPHMQPQSKTKTLSGLDSSNQSQVPQMPKPKPPMVVDLDSESLIPHEHPQSKTKPLLGLDPPNKSQVPQMPKPKPPTVVDLDSESLVPHMQPQSKSKTLSILDSGNQSLVPHMLQPESLVVLDLDNQYLIPHPNSEAVILHTQDDNLHKGDKTGNQKYLAGNTSEVLLLGNSGDTVSSTYMDVDEEKTNGSSLGSINSLAIAQTNLELVSINHHRKKMKSSASGACSIVPYKQTSINLDDDDVYDIPRPLARKSAIGIESNVY